MWLWLWLKQSRRQWLSLCGCCWDAGQTRLLRRPTPAFIYNFVQLTLAQAGLRRRTRPVPVPNWPGQVSRLVLYLFFSSRPSWHWHWLHGALLVSRVIYVPADTRWRWLKPFLAFCNSPASLPTSLPPFFCCLLACPFGVFAYFLIRSYPWAALFAQAQPKQIDFQRNATYAVTSCSPPCTPCCTFLVWQMHSKRERIKPY